MSEHPDSTADPPLPSFEALCRRAAALGLAVRGAFHPDPSEFARELPGAAANTLVLLGFTGGLQWNEFNTSPEAHDGKADPLDRWSRRLVGALAREYSAIDVYPNGSLPRLSFQQLALRSESVHRSPIGLLIHPEWGLWHAYRGALILAQRLKLPRLAQAMHPCDSCAAQPCLSACPVSAFKPASFDIAACARRLRSSVGNDCRDRGCQARLACPVGAKYRYSTAQMQFHMHAFSDGLGVRDVAGPGNAEPGA